MLLEKEREALTERLLEDRTAGWELDRALTPETFTARLLMAVGEPLAKK